MAPFRNAAAQPAIDVEAGGLEWSFDEQQLSRALHNLVANAVQYTPPNGWVKVAAAIADDQLEIAVEDSGPGVPDELKTKIVEPLVSSRSKGSGLGLAIVREIVEAHGGNTTLHRRQRRRPSRNNITTLGALIFLSSWRLYIY